MERRSKAQRGKRERRETGGRVAVDILLNKYVGGRPYLCRATNISSGGLLLKRVREPANSETRVGLQFQLPGDGRVITCAAEVVHEHRWMQASGLRFTSMSPEHRQLLDTYLAQAS